ncbi:MAG: S-layer homology domain-containing protein [Bacillota bacterium]|nr:S-layer homology domain-containing protein [Bacillota bacterium]
MFCFVAKAYADPTDTIYDLRTFDFPGTGTGTSQDGDFLVSASNYGLVMDGTTAFVNDSDMQGQETVYIEVKNFGSLGSFNLKSVDVGEWNDGIFQNVIIKGYVGETEVFSTKPYNNSNDGTAVQHFNLQMITAENRPVDSFPIDSFRIYYTKGAGLGFSHVDFGLYSFTISNPSSDIPLDSSSASAALTVSGNKTAGSPFDIGITGAKNTIGENLTGDVNVTVTSNTMDGEVFNGSVTFAAGAGTVTIPGNKVTVTGAQTYTVAITGVTSKPTVAATVVPPDLSAANVALKDAGNKQTGLPFDINITGAKNTAGTNLTGAVNVTIASDKEGQVFNGNITFTAGAGTVTIPGNKVTVTGAQTYTVTITGVTLSHEVGVTIIPSDFSTASAALVVDGDKTIGKPFDINITGAKNAAGINLSGTVNVTVTSDKEGQIYNGNVTFTAGSATVTISGSNVKATGTQTYTMEITGVTPHPTVQANIILPTYTIQAISPQTMRPLNEGYGAGTQETKKITIVKTGTGDLTGLTVGLSKGVASSFTITGPTVTTLDSDTTTTTFDLSTKDGQAVGTYTDTVVISAASMDAVHITVTQVVNPKPELTHDVAGNSKVFSPLVAGYSDGTQEAMTVTVTAKEDNTGVTASLSGVDKDSFELVENIDGLLNGATGTFTVRPKNGLTAKTYNATVTITSNEFLEGVSFTVTQVVKPYPTISISSPSAALTNNGNITYTITYTGVDTVTLANGNITLNKTDTANGTVTVSGSNDSTRTVTISNITGNGTLGISVASGTGTDSAGNKTAASGPSGTFTVDNTAPVVSISGPSSVVTKSGNITYTITYTGADNVTLANGDITLNKIGTADGTVTVSGSGNTTRTVTISNVIGNGTLGISVAAGTGADNAGNTAAASGPSGTFTVDNTAPAVSSIKRQNPLSAGTNEAKVVYRVIFSEDITGLDVGDFVLTGTGTADGNITSISIVNSTTVDVTIDTIRGQGTLRLDLKDTGTGITDLAGNAINGGYTGGETYAVDRTLPAVSSVSVPEDGTYKAGDDLSFTVNFSEPVTVAGGTPYMQLALDSGTVNAQYTSGSGTSALVFSYTVTSGNEDSNGVVLGDSIVANGSTLKDGTGNDAVLTLNGTASTTGIKVDAIAPTIESVTVPAAGTYKVGDDLNFTVHFSENVTVSDTDSTLSIDIGGVTRTAAYMSKTANSITYSYKVQAGDNDNNGISLGTLALNNTAITDAANNNADITLNGVGNVTAVLVDNTSPTVGSVAVPSNATYTVGQDLNFTVNYDENVNVNTAGGTPYIELTLSTGKVNAAYVSGSGTTALLFRYTVSAGNEDTDGIAVASAINLNGGSITDSAGNDASLTLNGLGMTTGVNVDAVVPTVNSVSVPANRTYKAGHTLNFTVNFSEPVTVAGGTPYIQLALDSGTVNAVYTSGSGTSALVFSYTIMSGNEDSNGVELGDSIVANGSTLKDGFGNDAVLTLSNKEDTFSIMIDTAGPTIVSAQLSTNNSYIDITFNEGVYGITAGDFNLIFTKGSGIATNVTISSVKKNNNTAEGSALALAGGETTIRVFLTVTGTPNGLEKIEIKPADGSSIFDEAGNAAQAVQTTGQKTLANQTVPPPPPTPPTPPAPDTSKDIILDDSTATTVISNQGDRTVTTVTVDDSKVVEKLQENATVVIPTNNSSDVVVGQLNGQTVKSMEEKDAVLEIRTGNVTYTLPASQINIDGVSDQIGTQVALRDIKVNVEISTPPQVTVNIVEGTAGKNNYQIVVRPVDFNITCASSGKTVDVSRFNGYVERTVAIPDGIDPSKITTGIVLNSDGTFSHVPTTVIKISGKYYARINSLTNSTYSVIWNPKTFKDVENHWSRDIVNDAGSRLIINGVTEDTFAPDKSISRAEFTAILVRSLGLMRTGTGKDSYSDVNKDDWYYDAISIANDYKLVLGYSDGTFKPGKTITREEAMTMIARAMKLTGKFDTGITDPEASNVLSKFKDNSGIAKWAMQSIALCVRSEVAAGSNGMLTPKNNITRAETTALVMRMLQKAELIN